MGQFQARLDLDFSPKRLEVLTESADEASPADDGRGQSHERLVDVVADLPADA
jgi:hypothetical protein